MVLLCISATSAADTLEEDLAVNATADEAVSVDAAADEVASTDANDEAVGIDEAEATLSGGNTIIVDGGGNGKISAAISSASSGDTIYIKNGEYTEDTITFEKSLNIVGEGQDRVILKKNTGNSELFVCTGNYDLTFADFSIKDSSKTGGTGLLRFGAGNINWFNCTFDNLASKYGAMQYSTTGTVNIEDCIFTNVREASTGSGTGAIYISSGATVNINNCLFDGCGNVYTSGQMYGLIYQASRTGSMFINATTITNTYGPSNSIIRTQTDFIIRNSKIYNNTIECRSGTIAGESIFYGTGAASMDIQQCLIANNTCPKYLLYANTANPVTFNYNNVYDNDVTNDFGYDYSTSNKDLNYNYWGEAGKPADIPDSISGITIVKDGDNYKLSTGEDLTVIIPGLNDGDTIDPNTTYVSPDGSDDNNGSSEAPVKTIAKAVELAASKNGQIVIAEGTYIENNIVLDPNVFYTITGKGDVVINGNASSNSIFIMHGGQATFTNIRFTNNKPKYGGAIFVNYETGTSRTVIDINLTVDKCTFDNLESTSRGGAIYAWYTTGNLIVKDSTFKNINGGSYGAVTTGFSAFDNGLNVEISGSTFEGNTANNGAAAYLQAKTVTIKDSVFANNTATYGPGAIFLYNGTATIDNCKIYNNSAVGAGAAIHTTMPSSAPITTVTITNSVIENNYGTSETLPAIYVDMNILDISYCALINDLSVETRTASSYDGVYGQGVAIANNNWWGTNDPSSKVKGKEITLDKWVIMNVKANATEVVLYDEVEITVDFNHVNTTIGVVEELTGGVIPVDSFTVNFSVNNGTITPATVEVLKGESKSVIYEVADPSQIVTVTSGDVQVQLEFSSGEEPYFGVIYLSADGDDKNNGSESAPVATLDKAMALALHKHGSGEIIILEGTYAGSDYQLTRNLTVTGVGKVTLDNENKATSMFNIASGAGVGTLSFNNLNIINVARGYGAFVYNYGASEVILDNITFVGNTNTNVRFITSNTGTLTIKNSVMSNNTLGGIICHSGSGNLTIINSKFENNIADKDSGVYGLVYFSSGSGAIIIEDSVFKNNTVRQNIVYSSSGYSTPGNAIYMRNTEISDTKSDIGHGAAIRAQDKLVVDNCIFLNNKAYRNGGAINIDSKGDAVITNSIFMGNEAGSSDKGDIIYNSGKLTINYCVLLNDATHKSIYNAGSYSVNAQYNWWGTNEDPKYLNGVDRYYDWDEYEYVDCEYPDASNWIVMNITSDITGPIKVGDSAQITADFTKYMDSNGTLQTLTKQLPEFTLTATSNLGQLDSNEPTVKNGVANIVYTAVEDGHDWVNITSGLTFPIEINVYVPGAIYVSAAGNDSNNGSSEEFAVATIAKAIELAEAGKIIILDGTYTIDSTLKVEKDLDIKGKGTVTIDGNSLRILENTANLNLTNIAFTNAKSAMGSAILDDGNMFITNCTFFSNRATATSSGNIINNRKGTLVLDNTKFYENVASRGAVASQSGTVLLVNNSEFYNNDMTSLSTTYGIIYSASADTVIENTVFRNNKDKSGGAIYATRAGSATTGTLDVINCTFDNNTANQGTGGAIFAGRTPTTIRDSTFTNNNAVSGSYVKGQGGAVYQTIDDVISVMDIDNCIFINNTAGDTGAAFYVNTNQGKFTVSNSVILNKEGDTTPALDKKDGSTTVIDANNNYWGNNTAPSGEDIDTVITLDVVVTPADAQAGDEITIKATFSQDVPDGVELTFTSTTNKLNETVAVVNKTASVTYTLDANDHEIVISYDGIVLATLPFNIPDVIYVLPGASDSNYGTIDDPVGTIERALQLAVKGNIVLLEGTHKVSDLGIISTDLNITGNGNVIVDAQNNNRIMYVGSDAKVTIANVIMINGYNAEGSGGLLGNSNELTLINCTLANSSAGSNNGGAIYNVGKLTIINSTFSNNVAKEGGAIFTNDALAIGASMIIENSAFENNVATGNENLGGGAIFTQQVAEFTIANSTFKNNKAQGKSSGGAIFISHSTATISITDSEFIANHANGQSDVGGGAIYMTGTSNYERKGTLDIKNTLFDSNTAGYDGGAIYVRATTLKIANSVLINNKDQNGYAIFGYGTEQVNPSITANDNWWGSNADPKDSVGGYRFTPSVARWAIMTVTNSSEIKEGENVTITVSINNYTTGSETGAMENPITIQLPVIIKTTFEDIEGTLENGEFTTEYTVPADLKYISATVNGETAVLYVVQTSTSVEIDNVTAMKGQNVNFEINVVASDGTIINQGYVELYIGNDLIATIDVEDGKASKKIMITNDIGVYNLTAKFIDESLMFSQSSAVATLNVSGINNVVTQENFFDFFDVTGALLIDVPFDELFFKGEFKNLGIDKILLYKSITITGVNATLHDIGFTIMGNNVKLDNIAMEINGVDYATTNEGAAILVYGAGNVILNNLDVNYITPDNSEAFAVYILDSIGVNLTDSKIAFDANNYASVHNYALHIRDSKNVVVKGNLINGTLPSLDVDYSYWGSIDTDLVLAVGIQDGENIKLIENSIYSNVKSASGDYATLDTIMIYGTKNILISHNNITEIDVSGQGVAGYSNVVDLYAFENALIEYNSIYVKTTTGVEGAGTAYPIQLTGSYSGLVIDHNNLTAIARGPALGIYSQNYYGTTDITVTNNFINVTGLATGNYYALVSGMELQDTVAKVYNNTIYSYNVGDGIDGLFGISYAQSTGGLHTYDIQNNTIVTEGEYAVFLMSAEDSTVTGNILYAADLKGDSAVSIGGGSGNTVKDNYPPFPVDVTIEVGNVFIGNDNTVTIRVANATGNVTIKLNNVDYGSVALKDGVATKVLLASDFVAGENTVSVDYTGDNYYKAASNSTVFKVLDGIVTNSTYSDYFDASGYLNAAVPDGVILDFQGMFKGKYPMFINKAVNIISSTGDAVIDSSKTATFNVIAGGAYTNVTGLNFINTVIFVTGAQHVTFDSISTLASMSGVGSGTGFVCFRAYSEYGTVKNSYLHNAGNGGSSVVVAGGGAPYLTVDNNVFNITGSSGNIISGNTFTSGSAGPVPDHLVITNNVIYNSMASNPFCRAISLLGSYNVIENNTIHQTSNSIMGGSYNTYRNNTITGTVAFQPGANAILDNNRVQGTTTVAKDALASGNEFGAMTISGANAVVEDNIINGAVTISGKNVTFTSNVMNGMLTVSSNENTIKSNNITSTGNYAVDLKTSKDNTVTLNRLVSASKEGDAAVNGNVETNVIENNYRLNSNLAVSVDDITIGGKAIVNVSINSAATGSVEIIVDGKKYELPIKNGVVSVEIPDLAVGEYTVGVTYAGDYNVLAGENSTSFKVSKLQTTAIITTSELKVGQDVNVTVTIEGATGEVNLVVDKARITLPLNNGTVTYTIKAITAGEHSVTAIYFGDASHDFVTNTTKFTVDKLSTSISVNSVEINYGENAEFDIVLAPELSGDVLVDIGGVKQIVAVENGVAHMNISGLKVGAYAITVSYSGNDMFEASLNDTASIIVNAFDAGLKANSSDINVSDDEVITIEIDKEVTGIVKVNLGNAVYPVNIVDGKGVVVIPGLSNGTYTAYVIFAGDEKFAPSEVNTTFNVLKVEIPSDINISMDIPEGTTSPEFTINLPSDATGNFTVTVDGTPYTAPVVNGTATVKVPELTVGNHTIVSSYTGDNKYDGFNSTSQNVTIPKASIPGGEDALNMTTPANSATPSFSINLPSDATGNLTVTVDGKKTYSQALVNGSATVKVPKLSSGKHTLTVSYTGDDKYSNISKTVTVKVPKPVVKLSKNKNINMLYSAGTKYKVLVTVDGKAKAGVKVAIKFNGKTKKVKTNKKGYAVFRIPNVKPKKYTITATYSGKTVKNTVRVKNIIKAPNKKVKKSKKVTKVKITLKKVNKKYLKNKTLKIKFKGKIYKVKTNKKGVATWKVKKSMVKMLKVGKKYKYKVTYGKDVVSKKLTIKK